jgi:hypothetical protein
MSISFFEQQDKPVSARTPFVEEYVENNPPPYALLNVTSVARTRKRTGYMVNCDAYSVFLYEGSGVLNHLLEALNLWIETKQGFQLFLQAQQKDPYFQLGVDAEKPALWILTQGKYSLQQNIGSGLEAVPSLNPFLPQTQRTTRTRHKSAETPTT